MLIDVLVGPVYCLALDRAWAIVGVRQRPSRGPQCLEDLTACPELPGCTSVGETEEEAFRNIREAIELYLEPTGDAGKGGKVVEVVV